MSNFEKDLVNQYFTFVELQKHGTLSTYGEGQLNHIIWCLEELGYKPKN